METEKKSKRAKKGWGISKEHLEETKAEVVHKIGALTSVQREDIMTSDARFQRFQEECVAEAIRKCQSQSQPQPQFEADDAAIKSWCVAVVKGVFGGAVKEIENHELNAEERDALSRWDKLFELRKAFKFYLKKPANVKRAKPTKAK